MTTEKFNQVIARADRVMAQLDQRERNRDSNDGPAEPDVEPLALAPRGTAHGSVALVDLGHHPVGARQDEVELVGRHFFSIGVNGEVSPLSLFCDTPSARAM